MSLTLKKATCHPAFSSAMSPCGSWPKNSVRQIHGLPGAAFAGFTLAAALASLYLVEERRLRRRSPDILRLRLPSLVVLERLTIRTIDLSWPLLTAGIAAGFVRLRSIHGGIDALMGITLATWLLYAFLVTARPTGRRAAQLAVAGFACVLLARMLFAGGHF